MFAHHTRARIKPYDALARSLERQWVFLTFVSARRGVAFSQLASSPRRSRRMGSIWALSTKRAGGPARRPRNTARYTRSWRRLVRCLSSIPHPRIEKNAPENRTRLQPEPSVLSSENHPSLELSGDNDQRLELKSQTSENTPFSDYIRCIRMFTVREKV